MHATKTNRKSGKGQKQLTNKNQIRSEEVVTCYITIFKKPLV